MYHARISIFKIDGAKKEKEKEKKKEDTAEKIRRTKRKMRETKVKRKKKTDTRRSDVAERDLGRPGNGRLVSRPQLIVQSKRNV